MLHLPFIHFPLAFIIYIGMDVILTWWCRCSRLRDGRRGGGGRARGGAAGLQRGGARGQAAPVHARVAPRRRARLPARHRRHRLLQDAPGAAGVHAGRVRYVQLLCGKVSYTLNQSLPV